MTLLWRHLYSRRRHCRSVMIWRYCEDISIRGDVTVVATCYMRMITGCDRHVGCLCVVGMEFCPPICYFVVFQTWSFRKMITSDVWHFLSDDFSKWMTRLNRVRTVCVCVWLELQYEHTKFDTYSDSVISTCIRCHEAAICSVQLHASH